MAQLLGPTQHNTHPPKKRTKPLLKFISLPLFIATVLHFTTVINSNRLCFFPYIAKKKSGVNETVTLGCTI